MHIRHHGDVLVDERHLGRIAQLKLRALFHRDAFGPHFHWAPAFNVQYIVFFVLHDALLSKTGDDKG